MTKLYKLTNEEHQTKNKCQWGEKITHSVEEGLCSDVLCTSGVIHACRNPNLALLLNPIHANIFDPVLWEAEGEIEVEDWGKVGCHKLTTCLKMDLPDWYIDEEKRKKALIQFAVFCAESVLPEFEKRHPKNDEPRKAIEATKKYLKNPSSAAAATATHAGDAAHRIAVGGDTAFYTAVIPARTIVRAALAAATVAATAVEVTDDYNVKINLYEFADKAAKGES